MISLPVLSLFDQITHFGLSVGKNKTKQMDNVKVVQGITELKEPVI